MYYSLHAPSRCDGAVSLVTDMEGAEGHSIGYDKPLHKWFSQRRVRHVLQEVRARDLPTFMYYYDMGYKCRDVGLTDHRFKTRPEVEAWLTSIQGQGFGDGYCTLAT
jgi:hypothetical protein